MNEKWSPKQEARLMKLWPSAMRNEELAERFGMPVNSVSGKAKQLGLPSRAVARKQAKEVK